MDLHELAALLKAIPDVTRITVLDTGLHVSLGAEVMTVVPIEGEDGYLVHDTRSDMEHVGVDVPFIINLTR